MTAAVDVMDRNRAKIVIVGPGAMGCLFAGRLGSGPSELWLLDKDEDRARLLAEQGVIVERGSEKQRVPVKATADAEAPGTADLVIICVKAHATAATAAGARPLVGPSTEVLSLQNGVGNVEALVELFGPERVLGGTTAQGANLVAPGRVIHAGQGETVIGELGGGSRRADRVARLFQECGLEARVTDDLAGLIWSKLVINAAINPLTALLGVRNGELARMEPALEIMRAVTGEAAAVCEKKGIRLLFPDPFAKAVAVAQATAQNISSMLQDVRKKRRTEIDQISGAVAEEAQTLGLEAPVNRCLALAVKALEQAYPLPELRAG